MFSNVLYGQASQTYSETLTNAYHLLRGIGLAYRAGGLWRLARLNYMTSPAFLSAKLLICARWLKREGKSSRNVRCARSARQLFQCPPDGARVYRTVIRRGG